MIQRRSTYSESYRQDILYDKLLSSFLIKVISENLVLLKDQNPIVLDLGCGEQPLRSLIENKGAKYISADIVQNSSNTVDYIVDASIASATSKIPDLFDLIILSEVLEHVSDPSAALCNIISLLAPNGKVLITTPFVWPLHEEPYDYQRLTKYWFFHQADILGLDILDLQTLGTPIEVLSTILLKTHLFAKPASNLLSLIYRFIALITRNLRSCLLWILVNSKKLGIESSSSLYLLNCLVLCKSRD